ncbi:MAG: thiamine-phosphate kinase [Actinomycetales bacterium]|nr:thiamine-phosphate kinase [Actinomycetales bacterium]
MSNQQTVAEFGEFALIAEISKRLNSDNSAEHFAKVILGSGDDSAVTSSPDSPTVSCVDLLVEGVHFRTDWSTATEIGRKAVAANLADIFAMGAQPEHLLVALAISPETKVEWVLELADGIRQEAEKVGAVVVGGDLSKSAQIVISVTAVGRLQASNPITRSGAKAGDVLAIAGRLGYSQAGLMMLSRGFRSPRSIVSLHRAPEPAYELARQALSAHSMIDISDGLVSDLGHIAEQSQVAINIDSSLLEIPQDLQDLASAFTADAMQWLLHGGEDHAFAATFANGEVPARWQVIGSVTSGYGVLVDGEEVEPRGWNHFSSGK